MTPIDEQLVITAVKNGEGWWVATTDEPPMFGEGDDAMEAVSALLVSLRDLHRDLAKDHAILSSHLRKQLERMDRLTA